MRNFVEACFEFTPLSVSTVQSPFIGVRLVWDATQKKEKRMQWMSPCRVFSPKLCSWWNGFLARAVDTGTDLATDLFAEIKWERIIWPHLMKSINLFFLFISSGNVEARCSVRITRKVCISTNVKQNKWRKLSIQSHSPHYEWMCNSFFSQLSCADSTHDSYKKWRFASNDELKCVFTTSRTTSCQIARTYRSVK